MMMGLALSAMFWGEAAVSPLPMSPERLRGDAQERTRDTQAMNAAPIKRPLGIQEA